MAQNRIRGASDSDAQDGGLRISTGKVFGVNPKICLGAIITLVVLILVIAVYFGSKDSHHTEVVVSCDGAWIGTITDDSGTVNINGTSDALFRVSGDHIVANITMSSGDLLSVKVTRNGMTMDNGTTRRVGEPLVVDWTSKA